MHFSYFYLTKILTARRCLSISNKNIFGTLFSFYHLIRFQFLIPYKSLYLVNGYPRNFNLNYNTSIYYVVYNPFVTVNNLYATHSNINLCYTLKYKFMLHTQI